MKHRGIASSSVSLALAATTFVPAELAAQQDRAVFDAPVVVAGEFSRIDAVLDVDGDGDLDGVGYWQQPDDAKRGQLSAFVNDGRGAFRKQVIASLGFANTTLPIERRVFVGDWNGDGVVDVAHGGPQGFNAYVTTPGSLPTFMRSGRSANGDVVDYVVADVDGDRFDDVCGISPNHVDVMRSVGGFWRSVTLYSPGGQTMFRADFDGDGDDDLGVVRNGTLDVLRYVSGPSFGRLERVRSYALGLPPGDMRGVEGDVDGDGDDDVVVFAASGRYVVLRRLGSGLSFAVEPAVVGGPATHFADVDGDGDPDGVCCGSGGGSGGPAQTNEVVSKYEIAINDGAGGFAPAYSVPNLGARQLAGAADFDGDGDVDLLAGRGMLFQRGAPWPTPRAAEVDPVLGAPAAGGGGVRVVDVDRDGDPDLGPCVGMRANAGDGTFAAEGALELAAAPAGSTWAGPGYAGDWDGDGDVDLIVGRFDGTAFVAGTWLLVNAGGGGFVVGPRASATSLTPPGVLTTTPGSERYVVVDVDGDGDVDLLTHHTASWRTRIWANDGAGRLSLLRDLTDRLVVDAADVDADGAVDLLAIVPRPVPKAPDLALVSGASSWGSSRVLMSGSVRDDDAAFVDLDGDGDLDVAGSATNRFGWAENLGAGTTFALHVVFAGIGADGPSRRYHIVDLEGDGDLDVVAWPAPLTASLGSLVLEQSTPGTFTHVATQLVAPRAVVDADGDGDVDAVGTRVWDGNTWAGEDVVVGSRLQFGVGSRGTDGMIPTLGATGPFRPGELATSRITGALGGTVGVYFVGADRVEMSDFPLVGVTTYAFPVIAPIAITFPQQSVGAGGRGEIRLPYVVPPGLGSVDLWVQTFLLDAAAPSGAVHTNGLRLRFAN